MQLSICRPKVTAFLQCPATALPVASGSLTVKRSCRCLLVLAAASFGLLLAFWSTWLAIATPAGAGVYYSCPVGIHRFFACVSPDRPPPQACQPSAGDPVDILTGRLHEEVVDWSSGGSSPLELKRTYASTAMTLDASPYSSLGYGWRTNFDARLRMNSSTASLADWANVILPDSFEYNFNKQNGVWQPMAMEWSGTYWPNLSLRATRRTDLDVALTVEGEQFVLRTPSGISYVFDTADHVPDAAWHMDVYRTQVLAEIRYPGGYVQKIDYNGDFMSRVSDNLGRWLEMRFSRVSWRSTQLTQVLASDGSLIGFNYQDRLPGLTPQSPIEYQALASVT